MNDIQSWVHGRKPPVRYCPYCDRAVPPEEVRGGRHDEATGGCGNRLAPLYP